jgi:hypothetical protein
MHESDDSNARSIRTFKAMQNKRLIIILLISLALLLIPLIAMKFTDEVNWTIADFIIAGSLFVGTGLISEIVMRKVKNINNKVGLILAILIIVFLIWIELAVGVFGTPFGGN